MRGIPLERGRGYLYGQWEELSRWETFYIRCLSHAGPSCCRRYPVLGYLPNDLPVRADACRTLPARDRTLVSLHTGPPSRTSLPCSTHVNPGYPLIRLR